MTELPGKTRIRAAQYVRMSTDHQKYSIANQTAAIAEYAEAHGFEVVQTYADEGKSGLAITRRSGLLELLETVQAKRANFSVLLVYDVSRWGRFQDPDESAFYEFLCRAHGVSLIYCAEQFGDETGPLASIIKNIKRTMAAEYSRELSVKITAALRRRVANGFYLGSRPGLGFARMLVSPEGEFKTILRPGDRKALADDYVILVPGKPADIALARRIFRLFADKGMAEDAIARQLNAEGHLCARGSRWYATSIKWMLQSEAYIGHSVYFRSTAALGGCRRPIPSDCWMRVENAFEPIVPLALFRRAQAVYARRQVDREPSIRLARLEALFKREGHLSHKLMKAEPGMVLPSTYAAMFGSMHDAYAMVGFRSSWDPSYIALKKRIRSEILDGFKAHGRTIRAFRTSSFIVDEAWSITLVLARGYVRPCGDVWSNRMDLSDPSTITLVALTKPGTTTLQEYLLLPKGSVQKYFFLRADDNCMEPYRHPDLTALFSLRP